MSNPFADDGYDERLDAKKSGPIKSYTTTSASGNSFDDDVNFYEQEIEKYMQQSLDSTQRSRAHLEQSEQIGVATAQDLLEQREKLERTNRNLDEIERTTAHTQRNLNAIKSVFGGFFNRFSKAPKDAPAKSEISKAQSDSKLGKTVDSLKSTGPAATYEPGQRTLAENSRQAIRGTRWEAMDNEIDENLDAMSANLKRLQVLGSELGSEIDDQNKLLDQIQVKADRNDLVIRKQDNEMKKILGYKPGKVTDQAAFASTSKKN